MALWAFVRLRRSDSLGDAILLGAAIGLGFLARYGMAFFVGSMLLALVNPGEASRIGPGAGLGSRRGMLVVSPNLYWNLANGFATFGHTADNAKWSGSLVHPLKALEFFGAQFGVFGPVLFGALLIIVGRAASFVDIVARQVWGLTPSSSRPPAARLRVADHPHLYRAGLFVACACQLGRGRLHRGNRARDGDDAAGRRTAGLQNSLYLHALAVIIAIAPAFAEGKSCNDSDPFGRLLGWREIADAVRSEARSASKANRIRRSSSTTVQPWLRWSTIFGASISRYAPGNGPDRRITTS